VKFEKVPQKDKSNRCQVIIQKYELVTYTKMMY
jgi:hypothetical protein